MKTKKAEKQGSRTITQARPYDSLSAARLDADQFVRLPDVVAHQAPQPAQWGVQAVVKNASIITGNPPTVKHQLVLEIEVRGPADKVLLWDQECTKTYTLAKNESVSQTLGLRYLQRTGRQQAQVPNHTAVNRRA